MLETPSCRTYFGNQDFYHIDFPKELKGKLDGLYNFLINKFTIKGNVGWTLRFGGVNGEQVFIENGTNDDNEDGSYGNREPPIRGYSSGNAMKKYFIEQYFPIPFGLEFTKKCMIVFEKIYDKKKEGIKTSEEEFKKIVEEVFSK